MARENTCFEDEEARLGRFFEGPSVWMQSTCERNPTKTDEEVDEIMDASRVKCLFTEGFRMLGYVQYRGPIRYGRKVDKVKIMDPFPKSTISLFIEVLERLEYRGIPSRASLNIENVSVLFSSRSRVYYYLLG
jgi:hypothetical protein